MSSPKKDLENGLGTLKHDVEKLRSHTADLVSKVTESSKEKIVDGGKDAVKKVGKKIEKKFEKNPLAAFAGAIGLGVVLGGITRRLLSRKKK